MHHYRKTIKRYRSYPQPTVCTFCDLAQFAAQIVRETQHSYVIHNRTQYDLWEMRHVKDHLMVIPKRHVASLGELNDEESLDVMKLIGEYETAGYNIFARSVGSVTRSIAHQHTHLLKTDHKLARFSLYLRKPYLLIRF